MPWVICVRVLYVATGGSLTHHNPFSMTLIEEVTVDIELLNLMKLMNVIHPNQCPRTQRPVATYFKQPPNHQNEAIRRKNS